MRYSAEHKQQTRNRILQAAAEMFRTEGYGAAGIDGLTKAAGVTNGAFYGHFKSKSDAFKTAVESGMDETRDGISQIRQEHGSDWVPALIDQYMDLDHLIDIANCCALPGLTTEVARGDTDLRLVYQQAFQRIARVTADGLDGQSAADRERQAIVLLALLTGGVLIGRAMADNDSARLVAEAVRQGALELFGQS
jgi:AcrR family transcriptional regulator